MALLTDDQIDQRLAELGEERETGGAPSAGGRTVVSPPAPTTTYIRPLSDVADALIEASHAEDGISLGLLEIDAITRGFRPSELILITGFAHQGKSQLVNTMLLHNKGRRILYFSLDEPAELVLAKLTAMHTGIAGQEVEERLSAGEKEMRATVREAAAAFENLIVVDDVLGVDAMKVAIAQATDTWSANGPAPYYATLVPDAVIIDYAELIPNDSVREDSSRLKHLLNELKALAKISTYPWIVLHQGTRTNARPGEPITQLSLGFTGEQQASMILGIRRKRDLKDISASDRMAHDNTCTLHVVKNKKAGGRTTPYEGVDFFLDAPTGVIRPLSDSERRRLFEPNSATAVASRATQQRWQLP